MFRKVAVAKGYRIADDIILGGAIVVLCKVDAFTPLGKGASVRLNDEGRTVVELRGMGELEGGQTWAGWEMDPG